MTSFEEKKTFEKLCPQGFFVSLTFFDITSGNSNVFIIYEKITNFMNMNKSY